MCPGLFTIGDDSRTPRGSEGRWSEDVSPEPLLERPGVDSSMTRTVLEANEERSDSPVRPGIKWKSPSLLGDSPTVFSLSAGPSLQETRVMRDALSGAAADTPTLSTEAPLPLTIPLPVRISASALKEARSRSATTSATQPSVTPSGVDATRVAQDVAGTADAEEGASTRNALIEQQGVSRKGGTDVPQGTVFNNACRSHGRVPPGTAVQANPRSTRSKADMRDTTRATVDTASLPGTTDAEPRTAISDLARVARLTADARRFGSDTLTPGDVVRGAHCAPATSRDTILAVSQSQECDDVPCFEVSAVVIDDQCRTGTTDTADPPRAPAVEVQFPECSSFRVDSQSRKMTTFALAARSLQRAAQSLQRAAPAVDRVAANATDIVDDQSLPHTARAGDIPFTKGSSLNVASLCRAGTAIAPEAESQQRAVLAVDPVSVITTDIVDARSLPPTTRTGDFHFTEGSSLNVASLRGKDTAEAPEAESHQRAVLAVDLVSAGATDIVDALSLPQTTRAGDVHFTEGSSLNVASLCRGGTAIAPEAESNHLAVLAVDLFQRGATGAPPAEVQIAEDSSLGDNPQPQKGMVCALAQSGRAGLAVDQRLEGANVLDFLTVDQVHDGASKSLDAQLGACGSIQETASESLSTRSDEPFPFTKEVIASLVSPLRSRVRAGRPAPLWMRQSRHSRSTSSTCSTLSPGSNSEDSLHSSPASHHRSLSQGLSLASDTERKQPRRRRLSAESQPKTRSTASLPASVVQDLEDALATTTFEETEVEGAEVYSESILETIIWLHNAAVMLMQPGNGQDLGLAFQCLVNANTEHLEAHEVPSNEICFDLARCLVLGAERFVTELRFTDVIPDEDVAPGLPPATPGVPQDKVAVRRLELADSALEEALGLGFSDTVRLQEFGVKLEQVLHEFQALLNFGWLSLDRSDVDLCYDGKEHGLSISSVESSETCTGFLPQRGASEPSPLADEQGENTCDFLATPEAKRV